MLTGPSIKKYEEGYGIFYTRTAKSYLGHSIHSIRKKIHTRLTETGEIKLEAHLSWRGNPLIVDVAEMQPDSVTIHNCNVFLKVIDKNYDGHKCEGCHATDADGDRDGKMFCIP